MPKSLILCGNYGSGKTEIALNLAFQAGARCTLIDLDIVNPYFRSSEHRQALESAGVRVLAPTFADRQIDIPALPAEILSAFEEDRQAIWDVGGTEIGAVALGRYAARLEQTGYEMALVVNTCRPFSGTAEEICTLARLIEVRSRLRFSHILHNSNLALETEPKTIVEGIKIVQEAAEQMSIPVRETWALPELIAQLPPDLQATTRPIRLFTRPAWL